MEVKQCKSCKKLFQYFGGEQICLVCKKKEDEMFDVVKEYLRKHKTNIQILSEKTGVPVSTIYKFIKQGRLIIQEDVPIFVQCECCGKDIKFGKMCAACERKKNVQIEKLKQSIQKQYVKDSSAKMRTDFLNKK